MPRRPTRKSPPTPESGKIVLTSEATSQCFPGIPRPVRPLQAARSIWFPTLRQESAEVTGENSTTHKGNRLHGSRRLPLSRWLPPVPVSSFPLLISSTAPARLQAPVPDLPLGGIKWICRFPVPAASPAVPGSHNWSHYLRKRPSPVRSGSSTARSFSAAPENPRRGTALLPVHSAPAQSPTSQGLQARLPEFPGTDFSPASESPDSPTAGSFDPQVSTDYRLPDLRSSQQKSPHPYLSSACRPRPEPPGSHRIYCLLFHRSAVLLPARSGQARSNDRQIEKGHTYFHLGTIPAHEKARTAVPRK